MAGSPYCKAEGCLAYNYKAGWCTHHWTQRLQPKEKKMNKQCKATACYSEIVDDNGYCVEHKGLSIFKKDDTEKPRMELLDPDYMIGVAQVLTFGARKYDAYNWQRADKEGRERIKGAMLRHQMAYMNGETIDPETGLSHMYHVGCNAMFLAYFDRHNKEHEKQGSLCLD